MDPRELAAASLGIWAVSDVVASTTGAPGVAVALALCGVIAGKDLYDSRSLVRAFALVATLFTSASGTNAIASSHKTAQAVSVTAAQAQEGETEPTPEPVIKPWW